MYRANTIMIIPYYMRITVIIGAVESKSIGASNERESLAEAPLARRLGRPPPLPLARALSTRLALAHGPPPRRHPHVVTPLSFEPDVQTRVFARQARNVRLGGGGRAG